MLSWILIVITQIIVYSLVDELYGLPLYLVMTLLTFVIIYLGVIIKRCFINKLSENPDSIIRFINA